MDSTSTSIYLFLGGLDAFAAFVLILKLYRLPLREYIKELGIMSVFIAIVSYFMRIVLDVPVMDLPLQLLLFMLFIRYVMLVKPFYSGIITALGLGGYLLIQLLIYKAFTSIGVNQQFALQSTGMTVNIFQITAIVSAYLIGYILKKFNLGFSFIIRPPHDFSVKEDYSTSRNKALLFWSLATMVVLSISLTALFHMKIEYVIPLLLISFAALYMQSRRRDIED